MPRNQTNAKISTPEKEKGEKKDFVMPNEAVPVQEPTEHTEPTEVERLAKKYSKFFKKEGMELADHTHALVQQMLEMEKAPELSDEIGKMRNITFNRVTKLLDYKLPSKKPKNSPLKQIDIQDVQDEDLAELLNADELLTAHIPEPSEILPYVSDTTLAYIKRLYRNLRDHNNIAVLLGPTGVAKTTIVKTLARHLNLPLYQETGVNAKTFPELTQRIKIRNTKGQQEIINVPSGLIQAALNGGIYLLDEFNNMEGDVQLAISQIVDDNEILLDSGVRVPRHKHFYLVLTGNPQYGGVKRINDAVLRRAGGPIEVGYLPESEEVDVVHKVYEARINEIAESRGLDISPCIPREGVEKLVKVFRKVREKVAELPENEALTEDLVNASENFSIRKMVDLLVVSQVTNQRSTGILLRRVIGLLKPKVQEIMDSEFNRYGTIQFEAQATKELYISDDDIFDCMDGESVKIFAKPKKKKKEEKEKNTLDSLLATTGGQTIKWQGAPLLGIRDSEGTHFSKLAIEEEDEALPDFDFSEKELEEEKIKGVELVRDINIKKAGEALERALIKQGKKPVIRRLKKLMTFNYENQEGFVLFGFEANVRHTVYRAKGEKKAYIPNKYRLKSSNYIFVADDSDRAKIMINPQTGEIKMGKKNLTENRLKLQDQGFIPARHIKKTSHNTEEKEMAKLVERKIWLAMSQASDFEEKRKPEASYLAIEDIADRIESAFEGRDISAPATPESVGKYLKYLTQSMEEHLQDVRAAHISGMNVLLKGPSGTGKTSLAKTYAIHAHLPYIPVQFHEESTESSTLKSIKLQDGMVVEVPYPLLLAYEHGWVAELRELNVADANEIAFLNTLLDPNGQVECEGRIIKRHKNFLPIATLNPFDPLFEGTKPMNLALLNRFGMQMHISYPSEHEEANLLVAVAINENPDLIDQEGKKTMFNVARTLVKTAKFIRDKMDEFKGNNTIRDRLQKMKMATDFLMNIMSSAKDLQDLVGRINERLTLSAKDKEVIEKAGIQSQLDAIMIELNKYI